MRFPVTEAKQRALEARFARLGVREQDLQERFVRSGGSGGQNVNKVATAVWLRHLPSGIDVKAQTARTQGLNRFLARRLLADRLEQAAGMPVAKDKENAKKRKAKDRRARRARKKEG